MCLSADDSIAVFWGTVKSKVSNLITNVAACLLRPLWLRRGFARLLKWTRVFIVPTLVAVHAELISPRNLALFTSCGGKGCLIVTTSP